MYRSNRGNFQHMLALVDAMLNKYNKHEIVFIGDFNVPFGTNDKQAFELKTLSNRMD